MFIPPMQVVGADDKTSLMILACQKIKVYVEHIIISYYLANLPTEGIHMAWCTPCHKGYKEVTVSLDGSNFKTSFFESNQIK